jgi:hypothetical protein
MEKKKDDRTHTMMPRKLAEALIEAGVQHFGTGGAIGGSLERTNGMNQLQTDTPGYTSLTNLPAWIDTQNIRQTGIYGQQQNLANSLLQQSMGRDPQTGLPVQSLAEKQLANTTGQNVAMQQGLMGSQRGANANPALMARQAARQGGSMQQQASGQAAVLRAGEQLEAQKQLQQQQQMMGNQSIQAQSGLMGALAAQNATGVQAQLGAQNINANVYGQNAQQAGNIFGGAMNAIGSMMGMGMAGGGQVPGYYDGGITQYATAPSQMPALVPYQSQKAVAIFDKGGKNKNNSPPPRETVGEAGPWELGGGMAGGPGDTEGMPSMNTDPISMPSMGIDTMMAAQGGAVPFSTALVQGGYVPGQAQVQGDSQKNDLIPAMLSPGEIVLPRSVTKSANPDKAAVEFLQALRAKKSGGYGDVVQARKMNKGGRC